MIRFGPAGQSQSFTQMGYGKTSQIPEYLEKMGLNAYEYQCGHGVRVSESAAESFQALAKSRDIQVSLHAPYYISLSSLEEEKRQKSVAYILQSGRILHRLGGTRMVIHTGSCSKISREEALSLAKDTLQRAIDVLDGEGLSHLRLCPETMGKLNQLGTLEEVLELCRMDERLLPCIDFGHLHARTFGSLNSLEAVRQLFDRVEDRLGISRLREFHSHFSKVEYTLAGGEKRHLTFADQQFGPNFEPVAEMIARKQASPVVICESAGTQAEDAQTMQRTFFRIAERIGKTGAAVCKNHIDGRQENEKDPGPSRSQY